MTAFRHLLVATDFGPAAEVALDRALAIAKAFDAKVTLMHCAWMPPYYYSAYAEGLAWPTEELEGEAKRALVAAAEKARAAYPRVETALVAGEAFSQILKEAKDRGADLIVMGTHGRHGLPRMFLGSVAEKIVRMSPVPVLTVSMHET